MQRTDKWKNRTEMEPIHLQLPFPPTANHYNKIRIVNGKPWHYRTEVAKAFYQEVCYIVLESQINKPIEHRVALHVTLHAPSKHRRDISNYAKCLEDALVEAGAIKDDSQIDILRIERGELDREKVGWADVVISPI